MKRLSLALVLLVGCGGETEPAGASLSLALSQDLVARITELQVTLVKSTASLDCGRASDGCLVDRAITPQPLAGANAGKPVLRVPFTPSSGLQALSLEVDAGTYLVHVEALDAAGDLVANACRLKVELGSGSAADVSLSLQSYGGPGCKARVD